MTQLSAPDVWLKFLPLLDVFADERHQSLGSHKHEEGVLGFIDEPVDESSVGEMTIGELTRRHPVCLLCLQREKKDLSKLTN